MIFLFNIFVIKRGKMLSLSTKRAKGKQSIFLLKKGLDRE
ncbi:hypothetical protein PROSTU_03827 [Providencia stuartii ATCC 25827]|uniref:Uncharacterized protein n=1 Tax=Providencia stuartii ATCC 25827 TaxID=471874 RepID=A0AA86YUU2_PROST|nr:hypothetical protein PROSTU_03827 [Providencia stuartii ATCC 25827]